MKGGEPLFFVRDGHMDIAGMLNSVTNEQVPGDQRVKHAYLNALECVS